MLGSCERSLKMWLKHTGETANTLCAAGFVHTICSWSRTHDMQLTRKLGRYPTAATSMYTQCSWVRTHAVQLGALVHVTGIYECRRVVILLFFGSCAVLCPSSYRRRHRPVLCALVCVHLFQHREHPVVTLCCTWVVSHQAASTTLTCFATMHAACYFSVTSLSLAA